MAFLCGLTKVEPLFYLGDNMKNKIDKCKGCPFARKLLSGQIYCPFFSCAREMLKEEKNPKKKEQ